ncbi:MAG: hypothetical protein ABIH23_33630 [bacterium]
MTIQNASRSLPWLCLILTVFPAFSADYEDTNSRMREMAGDDIFFGEDVLERAKTLAPGEKFTIDQDGDGDPDITIFNDNDPKHTIQPIYVKVIDEDDDQDETGYGDTDSDCWIADRLGDGIIDCVVDYEDDDGDDDVDRMILYDKDFYGRTAAIVCEDLGDDNRLWYTRDYTYDQPGCQWLSDFNGGESFCMYDFDVKTGELFPKFENPFVFYDVDGDEFSEIVIRFSGEDLVIKYLRYSFDVDNDTQGENRHDYDFSFNCEGQAPVPEDCVTVPKFRHGRARNGYVSWEKGQEVAQNMPWQKNMFIWDEGDNTANPADEVQRLHERWEGVGGYRLPECNFRREYDTDFSGGFGLYWWPVDRRIHLFGAENGELRVDYNFDGTADMVFLYKDTNDDGFFDLQQVDIDADGSVDREYRDDRQEVTRLSLEYANMHSLYVHQLDKALEANIQVISSMKTLLGGRTSTPMELWFNQTMPKEYHAADKLASSKEGKRYYQDMTREYLFGQVKKLLEDKGAPLTEKEIEVYGRGDYVGFAEVLAERSKRMR